MSLLIKALQKAEQGKKPEATASSSAAFSEASSSELSLELVDESAVSSIGKPQREERAMDQQAAATMFAAKDSAMQGVSPKFKRIAGVVLFSLLLAGAGFYYYLNSLQQPELVIPKPTLAKGSVTTVEADAPAVPEQISRDSQENAFISPEETSSASGVMAASSEKEVALAVAGSGDKAGKAVEALVAEAPRAKRQLAPSGRERGGSEIENDSLRVKRNASASGINPDLLTAYQAFNAGDDATAQRFYRQVLQKDVRNVDAMLGMAAIASRQGRDNDAAGWYGKVLEIEPRNTTARAAMFSMTSQADPVGSESRLKNMLAQHPESAHLHAALGDLYAAQNQWTSAQQAYFQAYHLDAGNAEYVFNLAASLDQMGKPALALPYYRRALELLPTSGTTAIDSAQLELRIMQLQQ